jgi:hypothetical protein
MLRRFCSVSKTIFFFIGELKSGKSYVARQFEKKLQQEGRTTSFIEVSDIVGEIAKALFGDDSRESKQAVKDKMKENPRFLADQLLQKIETASVDSVVISGLREYWIFEELKKRYHVGEVYLVDADAALRQNRAKYTDEQFQKASDLDNKIGVKELIEKVSPFAKRIDNNYEKASESNSL